MTPWTDGSVVVTGTGVLSALGGSTITTWQALLAGRSAVHEWEDLAGEGFPVSAACRLQDPMWGPGGAPDLARRGRELGLRAASEALGHSGLLTPSGELVDGLDPTRVACFIGTTMGESAVFETARDHGSFDLGEGGGQVFAETIGAVLGLRGPRRSFGTACAAGNYAIARAARAVATGRVDVALAGGVEPFSRIAMLGFARMRAMARTGCAPFGLNRTGMTLGEGAGFLVIQRRADAVASRTPLLATIGSIGLASDAHHPTAPREDGLQMMASMRQALERTEITSEDVGWVCAHGTGTPRSDAVEAMSLGSVFRNPPAVSSLKGALGHSLGAATAIEAAMAVCALQDKVIPPNTGSLELDEALGMDIVQQPREVPHLNWVMNNGFAFGGLNSVLLLGAA